MPILLTQSRVTLSTPTAATTTRGHPVHSEVQLHGSNENVIDASTQGTSVSKNTTVTLPETEQRLSLPVATGPSGVETAGNVLSVETSSDTNANVETENDCVHVETQSNGQHPPHVETTTADRPVMLHVHVEMLNIVHQILKVLDKLTHQDLCNKQQRKISI